MSKFYQKMANCLVGGDIMGYTIIEKLTNFLIPVEETAQPQLAASDRRARLQVHSPGALKFFTAMPQSAAEAKGLADHIRNNCAVMVNYELVNETAQQEINDFLDGVCYVLNGSAQKVSEQVTMYLPAFAEADKQIFAVNLPTYVKRSF